MGFVCSSSTSHIVRYKYSWHHFLRTVYKKCVQPTLLAIRTNNIVNTHAWISKGYGSHFRLKLPFVSYFVAQSFTYYVIYVDGVSFNTHSLLPTNFLNENTRFFSQYHFFIHKPYSCHLDQYLWISIKSFLLSFFNQFQFYNFQWLNGANKTESWVSVTCQFYCR